MILGFSCHRGLPVFETFLGVVNTDKLCVLCNRLYTLTIGCPSCGQGLEDMGLLQDFYGPYSAYEDQEIYQDGYNGYTEECCVHLLHCHACGWSEFRPFERFVHNLATNQHL